MNKVTGKTVLATLVCLLICGMAGQTFALDAGRIIKSAAFPGMGQLADGGGEWTNPYALKGLAFMTAEVAVISLCVAEVTKSTSYARETQYLEQRYHLAARYEERQTIFDRWQESFDNSGKSKTMAMAYGGAVVGLWLLNIADVIIFAPKDAEEQSMMHTIIQNTALSFTTDQARLSFAAKF